MQLAVEPSQDLLAVVLVKKAKGKIGEEFKRTPIVHGFQTFGAAKKFGKKALDSDVQMMPSRFDSEAEVPYTLDNYRAPLILDGRLYLFYEGATSYDADRPEKKASAKNSKSTKTVWLWPKADPVIDENFLYTSGHGQSSRDQSQKISKSNGKPKI